MGGTMKAWAWQCQDCLRECVPIRAESRCMCGHRLKDHIDGHRCSNKSCSCPRFTFIVAEGSWILRCRCKHKHVEHCPSSHACKKPNCSCTEFLSPWVCNCDHPWASHKQILVDRQVMRLSDMLAHESKDGGAYSTQAAADQLAYQQAKEADQAAKTAAAAAANEHLQQQEICSSECASIAGALTLPPSTAGVAGSSTSSSRTSTALSRLQASKCNQQQQPHHTLDAMRSDVMQGVPEAPADATASAAVICEGDLNCEVNRWDLLQRGR